MNGHEAKAFVPYALKCARNQNTVRNLDSSFSLQISTWVSCAGKQSFKATRTNLSKSCTEKRSHRSPRVIHLFIQQHTCVYLYKRTECHEQRKEEENMYHLTSNQVIVSDGRGQPRVTSSSTRAAPAHSRSRSESYRRRK